MGVWAPGGSPGRLFNNHGFSSFSSTQSAHKKAKNCSEIYSNLEEISLVPFCPHHGKTDLDRSFSSTVTYSVNAFENEKRIASVDDMLKAIQEGITHNEKCRLTHGEKPIKQKAVRIGLPPKKQEKFKQAIFNDFDSTVAVTNYPDGKIRNHLLDKQTNSEGESVEINEATRKEDERTWSKKRKTGVPDEAYGIKRLKSRNDLRKKFTERMLRKRTAKNAKEPKKSGGEKKNPGEKKKKNRGKKKKK